MADDTQSVHVSVGKDRWVKITGKEAFLTFLVIGLLSSVVYLVNFNLNSWGEPFPIKDSLDLHTTIMGRQHNDMLTAQRWNTYVMWACSPNNVNSDAKRKCSTIDLMRPSESPDESTRRRYRVPDRDE